MVKLNKTWNIKFTIGRKTLIYIFAPYSWYYYFNQSLLKTINKFIQKGLKIKVFKYFLQALQWFLRFYNNSKLQPFSLNYLFYNLLLKNNYAHVYKLIKRTTNKKAQYEYKRFLLLAQQRRWSFVFYFSKLLSFYDINKFKLRLIYFLYDTFLNYNFSLFRQLLLLIK